MKRHSNLVVLLTSFMLAAGFTMEADAEIVSISITAQVAEIDDPDGFLAGAIKVGDVIIGECVYKSSTEDNNCDPTVGDYRHTAAPFGITLNAGGKVFRTDPSNVDFLVEIVNDHGNPPSDNYLLRSYNNLFDVSVPPDAPGEPPNNHIAWQLDDETLAALSSDALPTAPPTLTDWQSIFGLTIESSSNGGRFFVRAHVTAIALGASTPAGANVVVQPIEATSGTSPVSLNFSTVTDSGTTSLITSSSGPTPSSGFSLGDPPTYYYLTTTAQFSGSITVCIDYSGITFVNPPPRLFHFENGAWVDVTTSLDTTNQIICGAVSSLSPFALFRSVSIGELASQVTNLKLNAGQKNSLASKLLAAGQSLERGNRNSAVNQLRAFINEVQALKRSRRLDPPSADSLIAQAHAIISVL